jgi:hypothetical protein
MLKLPEHRQEVGEDYRRRVLEVVLIKATNQYGSLPVGEKYTWTYKSLDREAAIKKARDSLVRDYPEERRTDWQVDG